MARVFRFTLAALAATFLSTAFAGHCMNESKQEGAGQHVTVVLDAVTEEPVSIDGLTPSGHLKGGFADVWIDTDGDGVGDVHVGEVMLVGIHSFFSPGAAHNQAKPVLPPIMDGKDPGGPGKGVGTVGAP